MIIDEKRLERQKEVIIKWIKNGYIGILQSVTGFGKTYVAILSIKYILERRSNAKIIVVVPTLYLKNQWLNLLKEYKLPPIEVLVINTASKTVIECDYLIVDEIHTAGSNFFINLFDTIKYKAFLGLTATLERSDGRHNLLLEKAPVIDCIDLEEALREGYISNYKIYNLPVKLSPNELLNYNKIQKSYLYYEHLLGGKFNAWQEANTRLKSKDYTTEERREALMFLKLVNQRKSALHDSKSKLILTKEILDKFTDRKSIIFCESIKFAEQIDKLLNKQSVIYHSKLTLKEKKEAIKRFTDNRTSSNVMVSCKALDAGVDISGVNLGICCAGTSKQLQSIQRLGRSIRRNGNSIALYFNLYIEGTQEEKWLKSRCYNIPNVEWITSLNEI